MGYEARCDHEIFQTGVVLDPFMGAGNTAIAAMMLGRIWSGIEMNAEYIKMAEKRIKDPKYTKSFYFVQSYINADYISRTGRSL